MLFTERSSLKIPLRYIVREPLGTATVPPTFRVVCRCCLYDENHWQLERRRTGVGTLRYPLIMIASPFFSLVELHPCIFIQLCSTVGLYPAWLMGNQPPKSWSRASPVHRWVESGSTVGAEPISILACSYDSAQLRALQCCAAKKLSTRQGSISGPAEIIIITHPK